MKVLVTGATGFLGQQLVSLLLEQGHEVVASSLQEEKARKASWYDKVIYRAFDLNQITNGNVYTYFDAPDLLMHLAWEGLPDFNNPVHLEQNLLSQQHFLSAYIQGGGRHILCTGTCLEYGMKTGALSETMEPAPICSYAIAKDRLRQYLEALQQKNDFILQWVRVFYLYGKGQNAKALLPQLEQVVERGDTVFNMSGGEQERDYLKVEEAAAILIKIGLQERITGIINCCSGRPITVKQLVADYIQAHGYTIKMNLGYYPYPAYEPMSFWGDRGKLEGMG